MSAGAATQLRPVGPPGRGQPPSGRAGDWGGQDQGGWDGFAYLSGYDFEDVADDGVHGQQLWATDGTPSGTERVSHIGPSGLKPYATRYVAMIDDVMFFVANDWVRGDELWRTDGTIDGTRLVKDINRRTKR